MKASRPLYISSHCDIHSEVATEMSTTQHKPSKRWLPTVPLKLSLSTTFVAVTLCGLFFALVRGSVMVLGAYAAFLACVFVLARRRGRKAIVACLVATSIFATIPWCDVGDGVFIAIQGTQRLPTIPISNQLRNVLKPIYDVSALPLEIPAFFIGGSLADVVYFSGEGRQVVRPFVVFVFWASISLMIAVAFMMAEVELLTSFRTRDHSAVDGDKSKTGDV